MVKKRIQARHKVARRGAKINIEPEANIYGLKKRE
jgi:hypothetical protein